jgi:DNA-binding LytR/AlgR family response regulator
MSAREIPEQKTIAREMFVQPAAHANAEAANLIRILRQLEVIAKRQAPRIAFKAKGRILFLDLADILAVQAEGNYVFVATPRNPYLLRESLSSMAEKLKPFGFIRIHRSVVVNISAPRIGGEAQRMGDRPKLLRGKGSGSFDHSIV